MREIESGRLSGANLENWFNCHVWSMVFDQAFGNVKTIAVVRYFFSFFLKSSFDLMRILSFNDQEVKARVYLQLFEKIKK